jgi:hypothetical protein
MGEQNVTGFQVSKELKQHGYGVANITDCFSANMEAEPARILTKKSEKSKQAKKLYLVTTAGIKYVEDRLNGAHES